MDLKKDFFFRNFSIHENFALFGLIYRKNIFILIEIFVLKPFKMTAT